VVGSERNDAATEVADSASLGKEQMMRWYHVIWNTLGSWLPGDPRGFRNRDHRIHSSGDYKNPPPKGEHEDLLRYNNKRSRPVVKLPPNVRERIADAVAEFFKRRDCRVLAIAVGQAHVHVLVEMVDDYDEAKSIVGKCKLIVSGSIRDRIPGSIWSRGADVNPVETREYQVEVFGYISERQEAGSWVWDFQRGGRWQR
jgi:REP element-mobilizing transposase RayT